MKKQLIATLLLLSVTAFAQFSDKELYDAYLRNDMSVWGKYVRTADFYNSTTQEKLRILNFEYGYIAYALSVKEKDSEQLNKRFEQHISQLEDDLPYSTYLTYCAALSAYKLTLNKKSLFTEGRKTLKYSQEAVAADPTDPFALTMKGNIDFYCPKAFGGNKQKALQYLLQARERYEEQGNTRTWDYQALRLTIAQCYEKSKEQELAIKECREILTQEPTFVYIRDYYLPKLLGKTVDGNAAQNMNESIASSIFE